MLCLSLPQTDGPDDKLIVQPDAPNADEPAEDGLPRDVLRKDEMRNEQLAAEIQSYFDVLLVRACFPSPPRPPLPDPLPAGNLT